MHNLLVISIIASTLRVATPLIFAALGGVFSEKSGVVNIGLEGMMIVGAFFGVYGTFLTHNALIGIVFAVVAGMAVAALHAFLSISLRADQVVAGTAINLFCTAFASFLITRLFHKGGQTDSVSTLSYNPPSFLTNIPVLGQLIAGINWFVIIAILLVFVSYYVINKTAFGLRIRAVGEHPKAADTLGINVYKMRYICVILSGALAGLGGAALSIGIAGVYREGMVAGRGFIAIAAMIFGNYNPFGALAACLLFAFGEAFQIIAQGFTAFKLPNEVYTSLPYILTMLALAGFVGKTTAPAADGVPYEKGQR